MPNITLQKANTITRDTYILSTSAGSNMGSNNPLDVGVNSGGGIARALMFFDLGLIPNDVIINSATLSIYKPSGSNGRKINVHKITSSWDANTTWNNAPTFDSSIAGTVTPNANGAINIDVKTLVQEWVNGQSPNNGFLLKQEDEVTLNTTVNITSLEATNNQPSLIIDYTIPTTGKKQVEYVGHAESHTNGANATSLIMTLPTGWQAGDLLLAYIANNNTAPNIVAPSGWSFVRISGTGGAGSGSLYYKFAVSGETNPTFTGVSSIWTGTIHAFRNVSQSTPIDQNNGYTFNGTTNFSTSFTATKDDCLAVLFADNFNSGTYTFQLSWNETLDTKLGNINIASAHKYMYANRTQGTDDLKATTSTSSGGSLIAVALVPITNNPPTLTLTSPANNQVLNEGNAYNIEGTASDADNGNVVTIKYKINNGTTRAIASGVSNGSTPISFAKSLTYSNKRLWDGATDVTGADLAEGTNHTLTVWAEDDQGGVSNQVTRTFTVIHNRPPSISGTNTNLGTISTPPSQTYTVTDPEGQSFTITEYLDSEVLRTFAGVAGQQYTMTIPTDKWLRTSLAQHTLKVRATDSQGLYSERTHTFTRTEDRIVFELEEPFLTDAKANRILVTLDAVIPSGATMLVEACNNAFDAAPTWEDITGPVSAGRGYLFTNAAKTAANWGINIRFTFLKGTATSLIIINGFGGAFD